MYLEGNLFVENTGKTGGKRQNVVNEWMARELNILPRHRKPFKGVCQAAGMVCIGPE